MQATRERRIRLSDHGFVIFQGTDTSVLQHQGPLLTSGAVIGIVVATIFIVFTIIDAIFCCVRKTGEPAIKSLALQRFSPPIMRITTGTRATCARLLVVVNLCMIAPITIIIFVVNYLPVAHCDSINKPSILVITINKYVTFHVDWIAFGKLMMGNGEINVGWKFRRANIGDCKFISGEGFVEDFFQT